MAPRERWLGRNSSARTYTCPRTPRALHSHFEAPRSPRDATAAQAAQADTPQRTQTARREDNTTNLQDTDFANSPPVQRQASRPALLLTAPPAPKQWWNSRPQVQSVVEPLHPTPIRRTRDCSSGAAAEQKWTAKIRHPRKIPPFQHHNDPGCCSCAEGAAGALQKNAPAPHLMPLGMAAVARNMTSLATPIALPLRRGTCRFRAMLARPALLLTAPPVPPPAPKQWWISRHGRGSCR